MTRRNGKIPGRSLVRGAGSRVHYFDGVVVSAVSGIERLAPRLFQEAPEATFVVGDLGELPDLLGG